MEIDQVSVMTATSKLAPSSGTPALSSGKPALPAIPIESAGSIEKARDTEDRLPEAFRSVADGLYRWILLRVGRDRHVAEDLLQQTCHEAARSRSRPDDGDKYEAWLRGIAKNLVRRHWRQSKRRGTHVSIENPGVARQLAEDMESRPLPTDTMIRDEVSEQLLLAVTSLPAAEQRLVFAFYFEGRSQADIAEDLHVTAKSVETKLYRVRNRLREVLKDIERT